MKPEIELVNKKKKEYEVGDYIGLRLDNGAIEIRRIVSISGFPDTLNRYRLLNINTGETTPIAYYSVESIIGGNKNHIVDIEVIENKLTIEYLKWR